ncbi:MAG: 2Fe-2S iron-sulfur cluster-binding protein [Halobacteria archaeon]|nr:2Fe-2S iron-sulfur cluster-binding protein [Halobacteria archaeon]
MESKTVDPDRLERAGDFEIPDELREAVDEEIEYLEANGRNIKRVRLRAREGSNEVYQATIHADDEMYRMSLVSPDSSYVSRTVFRNPESFEIKEEEEEEEAAEEEGGVEEDVPEEEREATYEIEFVKEGKTVEVKGDEYILDAGEEADLDLPFACREGECVACAARVEGEIDEPRANSISEEDEEEGYALTCVAMPRSDLKVWSSEKP